MYKQCVNKEEAKLFNIDFEKSQENSLNRSYRRKSSHDKLIPPSRKMNAEIGSREDKKRKKSRTKINNCEILHY